MNALLLVALAAPVHAASSPADHVCAQYAKRVMRDAQGPLLPSQAERIVKANEVEDTACHEPAIDEASRLIIARYGLSALEDAEHIKPILRKGNL